LGDRFQELRLKFRRNLEGFVRIAGKYSDNGALWQGITMQAIGEITDIDIAEAHQSKALMDQIEDGLRPQQRTLDFLQAKRWAGKGEAKEYAETWVDLLNHEYGDNLLTYS
jgi:hypothetical protein